jgi:hypothetical protein
MLTEQNEKKVAHKETPKGARKGTAKSTPKPDGAVPAERVAHAPAQ